MTEDHIKEVMRLAELWATYAWKACSHGADETEKSKAGRAALEAYLRTIEPAQSVNAELLEALKECMKWQAEGEFGDPLSEEYWSPAYKEFMGKTKEAIARAESAMPFWPDHSSAISDPLFHQARGIMGTENFGQEEGLRLAILHVLNARLPTPSATKSAPPTTTQSTCPSAGR